MMMVVAAIPENFIIEPSACIILSNHSTISSASAKSTHTHRAKSEKMCSEEIKIENHLASHRQQCGTKMQKPMAMLNVCGEWQMLNCNALHTDRIHQIL